MEPSSSHVPAESSLDYTFAFNNAKFSDRTLRIAIVPSSSRAPTRKRKRRGRRQDSNGHKPKDSRRHKDSNVHDVKTIAVHISTIVLAAKSPFFYKLFSNGMSESNKKHVTLQIQRSEEVAFMDLLKYMYTNTLSSTTASALLDVLIVADKYEVVTCIKYCSELLSKMPMTCESALLYLDLPSTTLRADTVKPLTDVAKDFLVASFKEIDEVEEEMLTLPLVGIATVLLSDDLQVGSEDFIYEFVMKWARKHYTNSDERREILTTRLYRLIRFPYMSCEKLEEVLTCPDINLEVTSRLVFQALLFKIRHQQLPCIPRERAYGYRPVKVIRFDSPQQKCKVYLDLKRDDCACILTSSRIYSEIFDLGGEEFYLCCCQELDEQSSVEFFGFYLYMHSDGPLGLEYEFSWRDETSYKFVGEYDFDYNFTEADSYGTGDLFGVPWDTFIAEDSPFFINQVLHLRVTIKIKKLEV